MFAGSGLSQMHLASFAFERPEVQDLATPHLLPNTTTVGTDGPRVPLVDLAIHLRRTRGVLVASSHFHEVGRTTGIGRWPASLAPVLRKLVDLPLPLSHANSAGCVALTPSRPLRNVAIHSALGATLGLLRFAFALLSVILRSIHRTRTEALVTTCAGCTPWSPSIERAIFFGHIAA